MDGDSKEANYMTYQDTQVNLKKTYDKGVMLFKSLSYYFDKLSVRFKEANQKLTALDNSTKFSRSTVKTKFTQQWQDLSSISINPGVYFNQFLKKFETDVVSQLESDKAHYIKNGTLIFSELNPKLESLKNSEIKSRRLYDKYESAAKEVQDAFNKHSTKLADYRAKFDKAQDEAFTAHNESNKARELYSTQMDSAISEFEKLEKWKYESIKSLFMTLADEIDSIKDQLKVANQVLEDKVKVFDVDSDANTFEISKKDAISDQRYQIYWVPPNASQLLLEDDFFKGKDLYKVIHDYGSEECDHLDAILGEVVIGMEQFGNLIKCMNINESVGYLPAANLEPMKH